MGREQRGKLESGGQNICLSLKRTRGNEKEFRMYQLELAELEIFHESDFPKRSSPFPLGPELSLLVPLHCTLSSFSHRR